MVNKESTIKKISKKVKEIDKKLIAQKWEEIVKWKLNYANQRRFFSLDEREQDLVETSYMVFVQLVPQLTWEDFLDNFRKTDDCKNKTKSVVKSVVWKL